MITVSFILVYCDDFFFSFFGKSSETIKTKLGNECGIAETLL